jgi:diacylglycerol kinase (ATP)
MLRCGAKFEEPYQELMRVSLMCNEDAGDGLSNNDLRDQIQRLGHDVVHLVDSPAAFARTIDDSIDLAVTAGGDGTVRSAAVALAGRPVPLAILPFGTANNIALSLGIEGTLPELIQRWDRAARRPFDVGAARGPWGGRAFVEAIGAGLMVAGISAAQQQVDHIDDADARLRGALETFLDVLVDLKTQPVTLHVDGRRVAGSFLLIEIMNIGSIGPQLELASGIDPCDGLLSVVTAREEHRPLLIDYLSHRIEGRAFGLELPTERARQVVVEGWSEIHIDDQVHRGLDAETITASITPAAVTVLV